MTRRDGAGRRRLRWAIAAAVAMVSPSCGGDSPAEPEEPAPQLALTLVSGGGQSGFAGTTLGRPLVVAVTADGVRTPGRSVRFEVTSGAGSVEPGVATTDSDGLVSASVRLGSTPGPVAVRISAEGFEAASVTTTFQVLEGQTRRLAGGIGEIGDMVLDPGRLRVYVTRPDENTIEVYSADTGERIRSLPVGSRPTGASLSLDGDVLFVALFGGGSVARVDLTSLTVTPIPVQEATGDSRTWDVVETAPGELFVSASPSSSGFAWIAKVDPEAPTDAIRVASNTIIRAQPAFTPHPGGDLLYVSAGFSPNSLYALDIAQPDAPIVLEDDHGSVSGVWWTRVDPSGNRIYLGSGQVLDAGTFNQVGTIPPGASITTRDDALVFVLGEDGFAAFETSTFTAVGSIAFDVRLGNPKIERIPDGDLIVLHSGGELWLVDLTGSPPSLGAG